MEFRPIFDIFHSLWPYLCSKGGVLSLYKQAICMRPDDEPFLLLGPPFMTGDGLKKVHFGPKIAKHGRLVNVPKWSTQVFLTIWDPFWAHLDSFGPFQTKMNFWSKMDKEGFGGGASEQKINFCLICSKRV